MNKNKTTIKEKFNKIFDFLFASHKCICCGRENNLNNDYRLCSSCLEKIKFTKDNNTCLQCGSIINQGFDFCIKCKDTTYSFDKARSVFAYDDISASMILKFKYNGNKSYSLPLAHMLKSVFDTSDLIADSVTFVPMPKERQKKRGYNQSYELCKQFSSLTKIPMFDMLERTNNINKQSTLNAEQRAQNIKGSFKAINKEIIKNREIILIDDVMTTGATANECALMLIKAGARNVSILTLARTPSTINFE